MEKRTKMALWHYGNEFLKQTLNFCFKLDDNVPRYGSTIKSFFKEQLKLLFSEHIQPFFFIMAWKCICKGGTQRKTHCHSVNLFIKQVIKNKRWFASCCIQKFEKVFFAEFHIIKIYIMQITNAIIDCFI